MKKDLTLDQRELAEIGHCLDYSKRWHHGTVGHNLLMLVAKLTDAIGFEVNEDGELIFQVDPTPKDLFVPDGTIVIFPYQDGG